MSSHLLSIPIKSQTKKQILEQIKEYIEGQKSKVKSQEKFLHIVSLNPENFVILSENEKFKKAVLASQIRLIDGVGVQLAGTILGISVGERVSGVDLMTDLLTMLEKGRLKGLLIGGAKKLANTIVDCYLEKYPKMKLKGIQGISDINHPRKEELDHIFSIVSQDRPHIIFAAFGSPYQELWFDEYKDKFKGIVCIGVGGGFDFLSGNIKRAPKVMRAAGLEWLYRLVGEPWRWRRQTRLFKFGWLVLKEKLKRKEQRSKVQS